MRAIDLCCLGWPSTGATAAIVWPRSAAIVGAVLLGLAVIPAMAEEGEPSVAAPGSATEMAPAAPDGEGGRSLEERGHDLTALATEARRLIAVARAALDARAARLAAAIAAVPDGGVGQPSSDGPTAAAVAAEIERLEMVLAATAAVDPEALDALLAELAPRVEAVVAGWTATGEPAAVASLPPDTAEAAEEAAPAGQPGEPATTIIDARAVLRPVEQPTVAESPLAEPRADESEAALNLDRADWQRVQTALGALGFDPRGVDGLPGPNTRAAIGSWQRTAGVAATGYLDAEQQARLMAEAAPKLADLVAARAQPAVTAPARPAVTAPSRPAVGAPRQYRPGEVFRDCDDCPVMVVAPAGSFTIGSSQSERDWAVSQGGEAEWYADEGPVRRVTIATPFAVGRYEVTRGEFRRFVEATGRDMSGGCEVWTGEEWELQSSRSWLDPGYSQTDRHPVVCVSWNDAKAYVAWLSGVTMENYRLLSEAEWEYAARAGTTTMRYWGDDRGNTAICRYANTADAAAKRVYPGWTVVSCNDGAAFTAAVGSYRENDFGLYDMLGNVWEWVEDRYHESYTGSPLDGSAWVTGQDSRRVVRGGSWLSFPGFLRSANRSRSVPDLRDYLAGFRVARTLR